MRFLFISFGVLCIHLALLGWVQVNQRPAQSELALLAVQTRQILEPLAAPAPSAPTVKRHPQPLPLRPARALATKEAPPPALSPNSAAATANVPLTAGAAQETGSSAKAESPTTATASVNTAAAPAVQKPSSQAQYLNNPAPAYPALSLRLNETGQVLVRVLIGKNGHALEGMIVQSSGFDRLDQAALKAVLSWRYVPGQVDGQPRDMWFDVPINFKPPR